MIENCAQFESFFVDDTPYKTILTAKYKNRKQWIPPNNRKVTAYLPGTVTSILVEKGDKVKEGQIVAKFEAMKMINNVQALTGGTVKEVYAKPGDKFPKGFLLIEFE